MELHKDRRLARSADLKAPAGSVSRDPLEWFDVPSEMGISLKTCKDLRMVHTYVREPEIATAPRGSKSSECHQSDKIHERFRARPSTGAYLL
eukprot:4973338-Amphidinium_carterae.1